MEQMLDDPTVTLGNLRDFDGYVEDVMPRDSDLDAAPISAAWHAITFTALWFAREKFLK